MDDRFLMAGVAVAAESVVARLVALLVAALAVAVVVAVAEDCLPFACVLGAGVAGCAPVAAATPTAQSQRSRAERVQHDGDVAGLGPDIGPDMCDAMMCSSRRRPTRRTTRETHNHAKTPQVFVLCMHGGGVARGFPRNTPDACVFPRLVKRALSEKAREAEHNDY